MSDYYDLSFKLGQMVGASGLEAEQRSCSASAQLALLIQLGRHLGLTKATALIQPMLAARTNRYGDLQPDAGWTVAELP